MKSVLKMALLLLLPFFAKAQSPHEIERMHLTLRQTANDTIRMAVYKNLGWVYDDINFDSSVYYIEKGIAIAQQLQLKLNEAELLWGMSYPLTKMGDYPRALKVLMQAESIAENPLNEKNTWHLLKGQTPKTYRLSTLGNIRDGFGNLYLNTGNYEKAIAAYPEGIRIAEAINDSLLLFYLNVNLYSIISDKYFKSNKLDSALYACQKSVKFSETSLDRKYLANGYIQLGEILKKKGDFNLAKENFNKAIEAGKLYNNAVQIGEAQLQLASLFQLQKKLDSSLYFSKEALAIFKVAGKEKSTAAAYRMLTDCYESLGNSDSSFAFLRLATALNDKIYKQEKEKIKEFQVAGFEETLRSQELEQEKIKTQHKIKTYRMLAGLAILSVIGFILYRNNRQKQLSLRSACNAKNEGPVERNLW